MKVLLTGANGFVGSHILECLLAKGLATVVLLRPQSDRRFIAPMLARVEVREGSVTEPDRLRDALRDVTHVVHCAGKTKSVRTGEFYEINQLGTRHLVEAVNESRDSVRRLVHISSLAASRPATAGAAAREDDRPSPVSEYGKSKLAAEDAVRRGCQTEFVILRPAAVYGPRDSDFLTLFKAVQAHFCPRFDRGRQQLSLVFARDLAEAAVACLAHPAAATRTYHVASPEVVTARQLTQHVADAMARWTFSPPLPGALLWPMCLLADAVTRLTDRPRILSRQKYPELRAAGWVCDVSRLREEIGFTCATPLRQGLAETMRWYRENGWLS
ncbi:MAG: NAD(P)-dependent oxidoreductase [Verrucomicrobia bacterium]|nr:NAD(P)-dependent oxidoreductase [Verrucomicrobiota bacterium]